MAHGQEEASNAPAAPSVAADAPSFETDVVPILTAYCLKCHGLEARQGGLDLRTVALMMHGGDTGPALAPGAPDKSLIWTRMTDHSMPPKGELAPSEDKLELVRRWIAAGAVTSAPPAEIAEVDPLTAEDRGFWSFQTLRRPSIPFEAATDANSSVDAFLLKRLKSVGLGFSQPAEPGVLARRLYFDLTGLPPTPEQSDAFTADVANQGLEAAGEKLVDELLASPHFGECWGRHWLDAAGYVDVLGSDNDAAIIKPAENKWLYRDYVVRSFNDDKPYDRFLTEQLAGDELTDWRQAPRLTPEMRELLVATGYLRGAIDDTDQKELNTALIRYRVLHLTLDVLGTNVLGLTLGCARCHSHKFDPIPHQDYYRMMATLTGVYNPQDWIPLDQHFLPDISPSEQREIEASNAEIDRRAAPFETEKAGLEQSRRVRLFEQKLSTTPEPIRADIKAALETAAPSRTEVQAYLAGKFEKSLAVSNEEVAASWNDDEKATLARLQQQIDDLKRQRRGWGRLFVAYETGPPPPTFVLRRGDHETPGAEVQPGFLSVLCDSSAEAAAAAPTMVAPGSSGRRLALARWLTDPHSRAGALTARVMANRVWMHLFGEGLVATPENFGRSGAPPSNPELLEWLSAELVDGGWRLKPLIRKLVLSSAYRQASTRAPAAGAPVADGAQADPEVVDPSNRLLWRTRLRRLESEAVRDALLAASGALDRSLGGPPLPLENRPDGSVVIAEKALSPNQTPDRRSLYVLARRNYHLSLLNDFDQPTVATNCARRTASAVVLQSLTMLNDEFVRRQAERLAQRVASDSADVNQQVHWAFRRTLGRAPHAEEVTWSLELIDRQTQSYLSPDNDRAAAQRQALIQLCHMLFNGNEFLYVE